MRRSADGSMKPENWLKVRRHTVHHQDHPNKPTSRRNNQTPRLQSSIKRRRPSSEGQRDTEARTRTIPKTTHTSLQAPPTTATVARACLRHPHIRSQSMSRATAAKMTMKIMTLSRAALAATQMNRRIRTKWNGRDPMIRRILKTGRSGGNGLSPCSSRCSPSMSLSPLRLRLRPPSN